MSDNTRADHENLLNGQCANLLIENGLDARAECSPLGSSKRIDVYVRCGGRLVALEAEIDNRRLALRDARARMQHVDRGLVEADSIIAVNYPPGLRARDFDSGTEIEWAVYRRETSPEDFAKGSVRELAAAVRRAVPASNADAVAARLNDGLELAVERLSDRQRCSLAESLDVDVGRAEAKVVRAAAKRALLIVVGAGMFHARLDHHLPQMRPCADARTSAEYLGDWPPQKLQDCSKSVDPVGSLDAAWGMILAVDYRPIFEAARRVLDAPAQNSNWSKAIARVAQLSLEASRDASSTRHDLLGRIFHRLLETARYDGSFYTSTAAAVLLAGLSIRPSDLPEDLADYKIIDPACGTGTLLMAAAERIRDLRLPEGRSADAIKLIEDTITGLDINTTACHMAATTLGMLSPATAFSRMNIRRMPIGPVVAASGGEDDVRIGSLDLLAAKPGGDRLDVGIDWSSGDQIDTGEKETIKPNSQNLVIMNPPFTRDSLRHDQYSPEVKMRLKKREKLLTAGRAGHGSSYGTMFMDLGEHLTGLSDESTLAFVYPLAGASAPSAHDVRMLLAEQFHVEWVVASHDPQRINFSETTNISEMLVVCRRSSIGEPRDRPCTKFVILTQNPSEADVASGVLSSIERGDLPESQGTMTTWPAKRMAMGRWRPLGFTSAHLAEHFGQISDGSMFRVRPLGEVAVIGPAGQRIRDAFTKHGAADAQGRRALWHNDTNNTKSMQTRTDVYIHAKTDSKLKSLADKYWQQRGCLLICVQPRLTTARVTAVRVESPVVGSHWVPARIRAGEDDADRKVSEKAVCAYLNSSLGWVSIIGTASPKQLSRPALSLEAMRSIPVPDISDTDRRDRLADAFDAVAGNELQSLSVAETDTQRQRLDTGVADALGIDRETIDSTRRELSREPSVLRTMSKPRDIHR